MNERNILWIFGRIEEKGRYQRMIHIAVCEDEELQADYLKALLDRWQKLCGNRAQVDIYNSAEQFLFEAEERPPYDLLLLDIQMGEMNGMELAREVRGKDKRVKIVFLTGVADYAIEGYGVGAEQYLLKPVKEPEFFALLNRLSEDVERRNQNILCSRQTGE